MITRVGAKIRLARAEDYSRLAKLVHLETVYVHRHLDWRAPLDWLGHNPFLVMEEEGEVVAALACPVDPPGVAWVRLFAVASEYPLEMAWDELWTEAYHQLTQARHPINVVALPLRPWFRSLLERSSFVENHRVVMLSWSRQPLPAVPAQPERVIRPMNWDDLPAVEQIDRIAFIPLWQNALTCLELAYRQATIATVAELDGRMVGYQISTSTPIGGHLARLAVRPEDQEHGIGTALLVDVLSQFARRGLNKVSVNTQRYNASSLNLYHKVGFHLTGEEYPVYQISLNSAQ
jgi:ribosomal protein S18 acetylase RimI-like enzyme